MRVLIDNGAYHMDNMGDVAMLHVAVRRVRQRFPGAEVDVLVQTPGRLVRACPEARPIAPSGWHVLPVIPRAGRLRGPALQRVEQALTAHAPALAWLGKRRYIRRDEQERNRLDAYVAAVRDADAVICSGGGFINDHHADHAEKVLGTLGLAQAWGKPTAMFGAGIGPITLPDLRRRARSVLRKLDLIALREPEASRADLLEMDVSADRIVVTGDDAIALPARRSSVERGEAVGVNVRVAAHAEAPVEHLAGLGRAVAAFAAERGAPLSPLPVRNRWSPGNDLEGLARMFEGQALDLSTARAVEGPDDLVEAVGRCRVVVTGAYHAAVFALAQGIPVVALTGSVYYDRKFGGLAEQFGGGITILRYDEPALAQRLSDAMAAAWDAKPAERSALLDAARRQIDASRSAYHRFFDLLDASTPEAASNPVPPHREVAT